MPSLPDVVQRAASWAGFPLSPEAAGRLLRFGEWLATEATAAGGLGPAEPERIWPRHLADSLVLGFPWATQAPPALCDLGAGVGLPGIPLAVALPDTAVTLIDRSGRRCRLMRRAARILGLDVDIRQQDVERDPIEAFPAVVSRAAFPPERAVALAAAGLSPGGTAVLALQHGGTTPDLPVVPAACTAELVLVPADILDAPVWLLRMQHRTV